MAIQWNVNGCYLETCSCDTACPCAFLSPPTKGECTLFAGWHIDQGHYGDVSLDGLNVALAAYAPGHMMEVQWKAALYLDERASETQRNALTEVFTGKAGGQPAMLASHIGQFVGIRSVPIEYRDDGKHQSLHIPNIAEASINDLSGAKGESIVITGRPWSIVSEPVVVAKSEKLDFDDYDFHWHLSNENGFHSRFEYRVS